MVPGDSNPAEKPKPFGLGSLPVNDFLIPGGQFLHGTLLGPAMYIGSLGNVLTPIDSSAWARSTFH